MCLSVVCSTYKTWGLIEGRLTHLMKQAHKRAYRLPTYPLQVPNIPCYTQHMTGRYRVSQKNFQRHLKEYRFAQLCF